MEISHGRVGTHSDAPGQVTSPLCSPQEDSVVHPLTYVWKGRILILSSAVTLYPKEGNGLV